MAARQSHSTSAAASNKDAFSLTDSSISRGKTKNARFRDMLFADDLAGAKEAIIIRCKNLALYIRDCESLYISDDTLKSVGSLYLVSMPGEVKYPTQGVNV